MERNSSKSSLNNTMLISQESGKSIGRSPLLSKESNEFISDRFPYDGQGPYIATNGDWYNILLHI